jgi:phytoene dehydrogenase-like protein
LFEQQKEYGLEIASCAPAYQVVFENLLAAIELHPEKGGVDAPIGGLEAVTNTLEWLVKELGVEIRRDTTVTQVDNHGVFTRQGESSTFIPADLVVVNANLPFATETLLTDTDLERYDWNDKFKYSSYSSAIIGAVLDLPIVLVEMTTSTFEGASRTWVASLS